MEDFTNYKKPSLFLITSYCDFKCCTEAGLDFSLCQNESVVKDTIIKEYSIDSICKSYLSNDITKAIVFGGLEPFLQFDEIECLINTLRNNYNCNDDIVIYTGYYPEEIDKQLSWLKEFNNIIVKFGRFVPNQKSHYDEVLGINLVSNNQYGKELN